MLSIGLKNTLKIKKQNQGGIKTTVPSFHKINCGGGGTVRFIYKFAVF